MVDEQSERKVRIFRWAFWAIVFAGLGKGSRNGQGTQQRNGKLVAGLVHLSREERVSEECGQDFFSIVFNGRVNWL